jgi:hypothetical protein
LTWWNFGNFAKFTIFWQFLVVLVQERAAGPLEMVLGRGLPECRARSGRHFLSDACCVDRALYSKSVQVVAHKDARGDAKTQVCSVLSQKKIFVHGDSEVRNVGLGFFAGVACELVAVTRGQ